MNDIKKVILSLIVFIYCILNFMTYMDSPDWIKNKKAALIPSNKKDKCFQFAIKVALTRKG